jgi:phosphohistidine phosphatase
MRVELLIVRHASAEATPAPGAGGGDDARPLSSRGRRRFERGVLGLAQLGLGFEHLLHSPKLRAVQTAELLLPLLDGECEVTPLLAETPEESLIDLLRRRAEERARLCLVGHEPWLSELALWLALGWRVLESETSSALRIAKGGVVLLDGEPRPGRMRIKALLPPSALRRLGRRS